MSDAWCKNFKFSRDVALPMVLLTSLSLVFGLACRQDPAEIEAKEKARSTSFWVTVAPYASTGPTTFITREPTTLPDGTQVVCVATFEHLWCRDAK